MNIAPAHSVRLVVQHSLAKLNRSTFSRFFTTKAITEPKQSQFQSFDSLPLFKIGHSESKRGLVGSASTNQNPMGLVVDEKPTKISLPLGHDDYDCTLGLVKPHGGFSPKKILIVSKTTRLQFELRRSHLNIKDAHDRAFVNGLKKRGTDFIEVKRKHEMQNNYIEAIIRELKKENAEIRVVTRADYTKELAMWSDLIISAGGDGTFLTAASKVRNSTPVIGVNTDPVGSEGHLCLTGKSKVPADEVIRQFLNGDCQWTQRQRIRVTITKAGDTAIPPPLSSRAHKRSRESKACNFFSEDESEELEPPVEPMLALNEVFIGESHAARVSYYEVQVDDGPMLKQKSSGMTVCTGTGSTSWNYNINRLTEQTVGEIIQIMGNMGIKTEGDKVIDDKTVEEICNRFNQNLVFDPSDHKMAFSVRDPVFNATFPKTCNRGFAQKMRIKSKCSHAHLVLDGSTSIPFNHGTEVVLELIPQDALNTVIFKTN